MPMLSIIVPVFNVEKYLSRCIDSILGQSFSDFELLLIDDGSMDASGSICDEYAAKDTRIQVFHKENGGVSSARNLGLDNAKGEWVYFVDSDDELACGGLEAINRNFDKKYDVILTGYVECDENGKISYSAISKNIDELPKEKAVEALYDSSFLKYRYLGYAVVWVIRGSVIKSRHLRFDESIVVKEDTLFVTECLCASQNSVRFVAEPVYKYYQRASSVMGALANSYNPKYITSYDAVVKMHHVIQEKFPDNFALNELAKTAILNRVYLIKANMKKAKVDNEVINNLLINSLHQVGLPFFMRYQSSRYKRRINKYLRRKLGGKTN